MSDCPGAFLCFMTESGETVGASLLAIVLNDNPYRLVHRGALEFIASKLAPTGSLLSGTKKTRPIC
jgi:hypothetical protein